MDKLFRKYLNGSCTPDEYKKVMEYIEGKKDEQQLDRLMSSTWNSQVSADLEKADDTLLDRIHHQIALTENDKSKNVIRLYQVSLSIAAVLLIGLIISSVYVFQLNQFSFKPVEQHVSTSPGSITNFQLPDGTKVWLNSGSEITYAGNFEKNRELKLKGEAFFDVVKSKNPFRITTPFGKIKVLGTAFDVKAYVDDKFTTTLERGSLEVCSLSGKEKEVLKPGDQACLSDNEKLIVKEVNINEFTSWKDGKLMFVRKSLPEVVKMLERWYNVEIQLEAGENKELWFTGTIEKETISEILEIIKTTIPIEYSFDSKTRIMKIKAK